MSCLHMCGKKKHHIGFCGGHNWSYGLLGATTCVLEAKPRSSAMVASTVNPGVFSPLLCTFLHKFLNEHKVLIHLVLYSALSLSHELKGENIKDDTFIFIHGFRALVHG